MKVGIILCAILAAAALAAGGAVLFLFLAVRRIERKLRTLPDDPAARCELLQQAAERKHLFLIRNAILLELCSEWIASGDRARAAQMFPFVKERSLFLDRKQYETLKAKLETKNRPEE